MRDDEGGDKKNSRREADDDSEEIVDKVYDSGSDDYADDMSQYSDVRSEEAYKAESSDKFLVKINEQFSLLLIMFSHNVNSRDLAFDYDEYDFMSTFKHAVCIEAEKREPYTPRGEMENADAEHTLE